VSTEKTEDPTPQRLRELRDKGEVPLSRDLPRTAALLAAAAALAATAQASLAGWIDLARAALGGTLAASEALAAAARVGAAMAGPAVFAAAAAAIVATVAQTGGLVAPGRLAPDLARLRPGAAFGQQLRLEAVVTALIAAAAAGAGALACALWLHHLVRGLDRTPENADGIDAGALPALAWGALGGALTTLLVIAVVAALADAVWARRAFLRRNRMSRQEIRDEHKRSEGDPQHRARRERAHRELLRETVREGVVRADVVVRNPTHAAVGLRYRPAEGDFPTVTIAGRGPVARQVLREAARRGVPVFTDVPTARAAADLEPGDAVPEELFEPIAIVFRWLRDQGWSPDA
jgi:type III secretion protein U